MTRELRIATRLTQRALALIVFNAELPERLTQKVIFYLLHIECGVSLPAIGAANGCTKQNVSKHINEVEGLRDNDPQLDSALTALEQIIAEA